MAPRSSKVLKETDIKRRYSMPTDDRGEDAPSRQKKSEIRMAPRRRKTTTEVTAPSQTSEFLTVS
uniref:Uncharacterized protein n=1 Tax=Salix viminalis TaxID=40686 RepID=A0A6N2MCA8_SALVM